MPDRMVCHALFGLLLLGAADGVAADEILRDPTQPYRVSATQTRGAPLFKVNAIFVSDERRIAIVNGQRVAVGGQVSGATVVAIGKDNLTLKIDGKKFTARLSRRASRQ